MAEPLYSIGLTARVLPVSGAVAVGDALVYDSTATYQNTTGWWVKATAANRTTSDAGSQAIALTAYGGSAVGTVSFQAAGPLAAEVSGLAAVGTGVRKLVRVSTTGRLERIDSYTEGDDVVGYAWPDGRVALHIGLPWEFIAAAAGAPGGNAQAIQYKVDASTFGGATHASISSDGHIEADNDATGGAAQSGSFRLPKGGNLAARSDDGTHDVALIRHRTTGTGSDRVIIGGLGGSDDTQNTDTLDIFADVSLNIHLRDASDGNTRQGYQITRGATSGAFLTILRRTNLVLCGETTFVESYLGGAKGAAFLGDATTEPSSNPTSGGILWIKSSDHHPYWRCPNGDIFDLTTGSSSETTVNVTSAAPGDITITSATRAVNLNASSMIIKGFTAPTTPAAGVITVTNGNASTATFWINAGDVAANGIQQTSGFDRLELAQYEAVTFAYDYNAARWCVALGGNQTTS